MQLKKLLSLFILLQIIISNGLFAQTDTSGKTKFVILDNEYSEFFQTKDGTIHQLVNHVKVRHGSDTLYCDTAILYQAKNRVDAIGNVAIFQADGTRAFADYVRYTGDDRTVFMRADEGYDVQLSDPEGNSLWSQEIYYNLGTKIGTYTKRGVLKNGMTLVESNSAVYNMRTKLARFKGNVIIEDPEYDVHSEDLSYHTDTKDVQFFSPSIVYAEDATFQTSGGTYNDAKRIGFFTTRSSLLHETQYIEADTIYHNEVDSNSWAKGNVIAIDTLEKTLLYAGYADYKGRLDEIVAYDLPLLELLQDDDHSIFIKGDTFYVFSAVPIEEELTDQELLEKELKHLADAKVSLFEKIIMGDTMVSFGIDPEAKYYAEYGHEDKPVLEVELLNEDQESLVLEEGIKLEETVLSDTLQESKFVNEEMILDPLKMRETTKDSTEEKKTFIVYPHPLIYSDSLQAKSDSMVYTQLDSLFTMYGEPVMWSSKQQITGEIIHVKMSQEALHSFHVPSLGIMVAINEPEEAQFYNQLQSHDMKGYFEDNELRRLEAVGNAASIYYLIDEDDAYVGVSQATTDTIDIYLENQEIDVIKYLGPTDQVMQPLHLANTSEKKLERFIWREEEKVNSWNEFFALTREPITPQLFLWNRLNEERWGDPKEEMEVIDITEKIEASDTSSSEEAIGGSMRHMSDQTKNKEETSETEEVDN